ncbi:MAG TPA: DUF6491 family protein [Steroidobacteraceae bacterium]
MKATRTWLALLMLGAATAAGAQTRPVIGKVARTNDCIFQSAIRSFRVLDDRHIVLLGFGRRDVYLVELAPACLDVESQSTLGTVDGDRNGQICGYGRDGVSYRQFAQREQCQITAIERLSKARAAELLGEEPE